LPEAGTIESKNEKRFRVHLPSRLQRFSQLDVIQQQKDANSQETAQNFEKHVLQKYLKIISYTYILVNLYHFHHDRCTLLQSATPKSHTCAQRAPWST
jgi:hypothetical protein